MEPSLSGWSRRRWDTVFRLAGWRGSSVTTYHSYNAGNELTAETTGADTTYYQYDRCGNTAVQQAPGGTTYYHWDHENLLTQLDLPSNAHNYFSYDADSKRVTKQDSEGFARFLYQGPDMLKLLQERDTNGGLVAHYTTGQGLEAMRRGSVSRFYHFDWLGSTFELTDALGVVTDSYLYNAWGKILDSVVTCNPYRWGGSERYRLQPDARTFLIGLRQYREGGGCFLSRKNLNGVTGSALLADLCAQSSAVARSVLREPVYAYAANVPTAHTDPLGLYGPPVHDALTSRLARTASVQIGGKRRHFSLSTAGRIAIEDQGVDFSTNLGSSWHFAMILSCRRGVRAWIGTVRSIRRHWTLTSDISVT